VQVIALTTPARPEWRWRIVAESGAMVEESSRAFPSIAAAVAEGHRRLDERNGGASRVPLAFGPSSR
jgi:hypothetical protein